MGIRSAALAALAALALTGCALPSAAAPGAPCPLSATGVSETIEAQAYDLRITRGFSDDPLPAADLDLAAAAFLETPAEAGGTSGRRALIAYVVARDVVCVVFYADPARTSDPVGVGAALIIPAGKEGVVSAVEALDAAISSGGRNRSAMPQSRGGSTRGPNPLRTAEPYVDRLAEVQQLLFPREVASALDEVSELYIFPAANIGTVPFPLFDPDGDGVPLLETTSITIIPRFPRAGDDLLAMAPITRGSALVLGNPDAGSDLDWTFPALPAAEREAAVVGEALGVVPVIGADATADSFFARAPLAEYLHIAAHGISDGADPLDGSFLALTGGRVTAREIQQMSLMQYAIVTISACQTGLGGIHDGGIIGLARAFILAGGASVVASLWNIDDEATADLMESYVGLLGQPYAPAEALRRAQMQTRRKWPDPAYWAGFLNFGSRIVTLAE